MGMEQTIFGAVLSLEVLDSLRELQTEDDPHFVANLMTLFIDSLRANVTRIEEASLAGDVQTLKGESHSLKSSSGNVGATQVSALCQEIELRGKAGLAEDCRPFVAKLRIEAGRAIAAIENLPEMKAFRANQAA